MNGTDFKVIIVGGGVSGLTLANALERADIDYVLLECRGEIAPFVGASIAISANGGRILDQLGCYETILERTVPMDFVQTWSNGRMIGKVDSPLLNHVRSGYPFSFMDRHFLLQTLFDRISDKSKILLAKRVSRIDHSRDCVTVQCRDGATYTGNVVVGADGVHSIVRNEMWRHMSVADPASLKKNERTLMYADYACMFAVSKPTKNLATGTFDRVVGKDLSFLHSVDKSGRVFWFVFEKLDKRYYVPDVPKFTKEDSEALGQRCLSKQMTDSVTFEDLWNNRLASTLVPLEEAWYDNWTWGRFACIGDSIHKWTPNIGQGGNNAIESSAAIANVLYDLAIKKSGHKQPSYHDVQKAFESFHQRRKARAYAMFTVANAVTRLEALRGAVERLLTFHILPATGEWVANQIANSIIGSEKLSFLPDTERSFKATMAYNQNYGIGHEPSMLNRALIALPFLPMVYLFHVLLGGILSLPGFVSQVGRALETRQINYSGTQTWEIPRLPEPLPYLNAVFAPTLFGIDPGARLQSLTFLVDLSPLYLLFILESHRRANVMKLISFPVLFGIAFQTRGIGVIGPLYFFLHYVQSPLADYTALDWRLVNVAAVRTALISLLLVFTFPTIAMYCWPDLNLRMPFNAVFQVFPITMSIVHYIFSKILVKDTTRQDILYNVAADLPSIRFAVKTLSLISALTFNYVRFTSKDSLASVFLPNWSAVTSLLTSTPQDQDLVSGIKLFMQLDEISCFVAAFAWIALLIKDMKDVEMTDISWARVVGSAVLGSFVAGPGAVVALAWLWREEILATKRAKGAVVRMTGTLKSQNS